MPEYSPIAVHQSEGKLFQIWDSAASSGSGGWLSIPGTMGWNLNGGGRTGRSAGSDTDAPTGLAGTREVGTVEVETLVQPAHRAWQLIEQGYRNNDLMRFQLITAKTVIRAQSASGTTVAIATATGVATFAPSTPPARHLKKGAALVIGTGNSTQRRFINNVVISEGGDVTSVTATPATTVAAGVYSIEVPQLTWDFEARVLSSPATHPTIAQGGELQGTLSLQPDAPLAEPMIA